MLCKAQMNNIYINEKTLYNDALRGTLINYKKVIKMKMIIFYCIQAFQCIILKSSNFSSSFKVLPRTNFCCSKKEGSVNKKMSKPKLNQTK